MLNHIIAYLYFFFKGKCGKKYTFFRVYPCFCAPFFVFSEEAERLGGTGFNLDLHWILGTAIIPCVLTLMMDGNRVFYCQPSPDTYNS